MTSLQPSQSDRRFARPATGAVVWQNQIDSYTTGGFQTAAPTYVDAKSGPEVIVGMAGGEIGVRGYVEALDAKTGKELWKTFMVPAPGDPGHATWGYDYDWAHGGASVWTHPARRLLYSA